VADAVAEVDQQDGGMSPDRVEPVLVLSDLGKRYDDREVVAGLSLEVHAGEVFGLLGPNGAGKTTTVECIAGLRRPDSGSVRVLGLDPAVDRRELTARVAVQPQAAALFEHLTVLETVCLFASFHARPRAVDDVIEAVDLTDARDRRIRHLSGGQHRRVLLAVALVGAPEVLILDEPSAGLDPASRRRLWAAVEGVKATGTAVVLTTHQLDEATSLCDRVGILIAGRLAALGSPESLVAERRADSSVSFTLPLASDLGLLDRFGVDARSVEERRTDYRVQIATPDPDGVLRALTFDTSLAARDFAVRRGSLEDLFIDLTSEVPR
jgi:ABC-2 type transport system ATP-binding protein